MGSPVVLPTMQFSIFGAIADAVENMRKPLARPIDLTLPSPIPNEDLEGLIKRAREELKIDAANDYNFAVVGGSGVGKSSFVNGIRLLEDTHQDWAPLREVESTTGIKPYRHPLLHRVVFWDLPGAGIPNHPAITYFNDMKLYAFDCLLILSAERFQRVDFEVAKAAMKQNKRFVFVRSKADEAIRKMVAKEKVTVMEASKKLREIVEASLKEGLRLAGMADKRSQMKLFIVSSRAFTNAHAYMDHDPGTLPEMNEEEEMQLHKMDEDLIYTYVVDSVRSRARKNIASRTRPPVAA